MREQTILFSACAANRPAGWTFRRCSLGPAPVPAVVARRRSYDRIMNDSPDRWPYRSPAGSAQVSDPVSLVAGDAVTACPARTRAPPTCQASLAAGAFTHPAPCGGADPRPPPKSASQARGPEGRNPVADLNARLPSGCATTRRVVRPDPAGPHRGDHVVCHVGADLRLGSALSRPHTTRQCSGSLQARWCPATPLSRHTPPGCS